MAVWWSFGYGVAVWGVAIFWPPVAGVAVFWKAVAVDVARVAGSVAIFFDEVAVFEPPMSVRWLFGSGVAVWNVAVPLLGVAIFWPPVVGVAVFWKAVAVGVAGSVAIFFDEVAVFEAPVAVRWPFGSGVAACGVAVFLLGVVVFWPPVAIWWLIVAGVAMLWPPVAVGCGWEMVWAMKERRRMESSTRAVMMIPISC